MNNSSYNRPSWVEWLRAAKTVTVQAIGRAAVAMGTIYGFTHGYIPEPPTRQAVAELTEPTQDVSINDNAIDVHLTAAQVEHQFIMDLQDDVLLARTISGWSKELN